MTRYRCYLEGLEWTSPSEQSNSLRVVMKTDGRFFDIDTVPRASLLTAASETGSSLPTPDGSASNGITTAASDLVPVTRAFIGDPRTLLFEYVPGSGTIVCDGQWGQVRDYTKHTPMTNWEIGIEASNEALKQLDFSGFTGVRMEFECEIIWKGL